MAGGHTAASLTLTLPGQLQGDRPATSWISGAANIHAPAGVVMVASERVLLLAVDLPVMPVAQRRAAVGFAVEDRIAQSLDEVQVALGPQISPGVWLVAVTAHALLDSVATGTKNMIIWPDVALVPVPAEGWSVWADEARVLVRLPDFTGFATSSTACPALWAAAGSPTVAAFGDNVPSGIPVATRAPLPRTPDPKLNGFDLRAGLHRTGKTPGFPKAFRPLLIVALAAALAHAMLLVLDVAALDRLTNQRGTELRALLNTSPNSDLDAALAQTLAARQKTETGGVLVLLTRVFGAIAAQTGRVTLQDLRYASAEDTAVATVEARDLASLQSIETALTAAGLIVTAGAATTGDGAAEVQMTIRDGGT